MKYLLPVFLLLTHLTFAQPNLEWSARNDLNQNLPASISVYETDTDLNGRPFYALFASIDLTDQDIDFVPAMKDGGYQELSEFEAQHDKKSYVTINGGFFGNNSSYSLLIRNFSLLAQNIASVSRTSNYDGVTRTYYPTRGAFGVDDTGTPDVTWVYTTSEDNTYTYPAPSPNTLDEAPKQVPDDTYPEGGQLWDIADAVGGGPVLLSDNEIVVTDGNPELFPSDIMDSQAPRTAIGYTADGRLILFVCDGRQAHSDGAGIVELAEIMKELGCVEAMNLDGGGSSAMLVNGTLQNQPSDGNVRPTSTAVMIADATKSDVPLSGGEMRAAWIASVSNLDWPKAGDRGDAEAQKADLKKILDSLAAYNLNAAFLQVRPECDALYVSSYEPWSRYLGGSQGTDPGYDPLSFAIEEAHKRGIELHAWLNPYRINASGNDGGDYYAAEHVYIEHPEWALEYEDGDKILNPGLPEVKNYLKMIVGDIIENYDVDGIHFDDYFYSYSGTPDELDAHTYTDYGQEYDNIGDFRRGSINDMIEQVWDTIQSVKPHVRFGISPFGIYGNGMNPDGIVGLDAYNTIYSDPLAWLEQGTVDYINPQLYWPTGGGQDYSKLLPWWAEKAATNNRHAFAGHGIYRLSDDPVIARTAPSELHEMKEYFDISESDANTRTTETGGWTLNQVVIQVEINRQNEGASGSVFFRMNDFYRVDGLADYLRKAVFYNKALPPAMSWKSNTPPAAPSNLRLEKLDGDTFFSLVWDNDSDSSRYVIYAFDPDRVDGDYATASNRFAITYDKNFRLSSIDIPDGYYMVVTALDRYGNESNPSAVFGANTPEKVVLVRPVDNTSNVASGDSLVWRTAAYATRYKVELSEDLDFASEVVSHITEDTVMAIAQLDISGETTYNWRVTAENIGGAGPPSDTLNFATGFPARVDVTAPANDETGVALNTEFVWEASSNTDYVHLQLSEGGNEFSMGNLVFEDSLMASEGSYTLTEPLRELYTHYLRVRGINAYGATTWSDIIQFKTLKPTPPAPEIISPVDGTTDLEPNVTLQWGASDGATSYQLQVAETEDFVTLMTDERIYGTLEYSLTDLEKGKTYWWRVAAWNAGGLGEYAGPAGFTIAAITGLGQATAFKVYPNPAEGEVFIEGINQSQGAYSISDITGRVFMEDTFGDVEALRIDVANIHCTPCILKITTKDRKENVKLFVR